jgi:Protein of unknown function (DUF2281)
MELAILEQLYKLPESGQQEVLRYIESLVAQYSKDLDNRPALSRRNAFGIWKGKVWIADDFDAPLDDFKEYME